MTDIKTLKALRPALNAVGMDAWGFKGPGGYKLGVRASSSSYRYEPTDTFDDLPSLLLAGNQALRQASITSIK